jgi:LuxR family transcriptional regulator, maltose regulon positive regulatory protein
MISPIARRLGELEQAPGEQDRDRGEIRTAVATLRLAQDDPDAAAVALAPVLDGSARVSSRNWLVQSLVLEAIARDAFGDPGTAERALERALDMAETDGVLLPFLLPPAPGLLAPSPRRR